MGGLTTIPENIKLAVVTAVPFPIGMAGTNRILSYSRGLVELGDTVTVLTTHPGNDKSHTGIYSGVRYKRFVNWSIAYQWLPLAMAISIFNMSSHLMKNKAEYDAVLMVSNSLIFITAMFLICKATGLTYIQEKSEFPFVLNSTNVIGRLYAKFYVSRVYRLFDGMIIMTHPLLAYFQSKTKRNCKKILLPMTVEADRFQEVRSQNMYGEYIAYCGYMGGNKDGVINLITSFGLISKTNPHVNLVLIGTAAKEDIKDLKQFARKSKIANVIFHGYATRDDIPSLLSNAKILALARPSGLQSLGGFPTKLGEYLATGKPVVVTAVGDIPQYLDDKKNAFIVEPDDNKKFAEKLQYVLDNYEYSLSVGQQGKLLTSRIFSYRYQSKRLHSFLLDF